MPAGLSLPAMREEVLRGVQPPREAARLRTALEAGVAHPAGVLDAAARELATVEAARARGAPAEAEAQLALEAAEAVDAAERQAVWWSRRCATTRCASCA